MALDAQKMETDKAIKRILIRGVNWIGDGVLTTPAIKNIRRAYPDSHISLLVKPWVSGLFENNPDIDELITYEKRHEGFLGKIQLVRELRKRRFDTAILLQNAFDAALIAFLSGIPERIGYSRDARGVLLTKQVRYEGDDRRIHHVDYYLNLLKAAGIAIEYLQPSSPWIYLSLKERLLARETLKGLKRPIIGINPGAAYGSAKRWMPERFAWVAGRIIDELGGSVVIFGGPLEVEMAEKICKSADIEHLNPNHGPISLLNMVGKTTIRELAAFISECDAMVTNDSGAMHIGYAVGTPLVCIFGSTDPALTGPPINGNSIVIKKDIECSPCFERKCRKGNLLCMDLITSDEVFDAVKRLIPQNKAVFFDRDGTLCRDVGYLNRMEDLEIFPEVKSLTRLKEKGFFLIGISNQSGIARGMVDEDLVRKVNNIFIERYGFDGFYYCPHHPDEHCPCRKPEPRMLYKARADYRIDLKKSFVVGDKDSDMIFAKAVGATGILVKTGEAKEPKSADYTVEAMKEAVDFIINQEL